MGSQWELASQGARTIATYKGRSDVGQLMSALSSRASSEQDAAKGSQLVFEVTGFDSATQKASCRMWLASATNVMGVFIADARFFRTAMNAVEKELRTLDPGLSVSKA